MIDWPIVAIVVGSFSSLYLLAHLRIIIGFLGTNEAMAVMVGKSLHRLVVNTADGDYYDEANDRVWYAHEKKPRGTILPKRGIWQRLGIYWIGFPILYHALWYKFARPRLVQEGEETTGKKIETDKMAMDIVVKTEWVPTLVLRWPVPIKVTGVELKRNVIVTAIFIATLEIVYPKRTLFGLLPIGIWINKAIAVISGRVRDYGGDIDLETLRKEQNAKSGSKFEQYIKDNNAELLREVGVRVTEVDFQAYKVEDPELEKTFQADAVAREKAKAAKAEAEGKAKARERLAKALQAEMDAEAAGLGNILSQADTPEKLAYATARTNADAIRAWRPTVIGSATPMIPLPAPPTTPPPTP
jgi:hypothetical protein